MFNKKKCVLGLVLFLCISILVVIIKNTHSVRIDTILKTSDYSYLSDVAKEYIVHVYEDTGEVLLTERNKEQNVPYLNPEYVEYLNYINGDNVNEEFSYDVIPSETILDYVDSSTVASSEFSLPSKFDLRNVDGKNYVSPVKDQESTGLCWAFATNANAESHLLVKNNSSYVAGSSQLFSEMQIDYALASNGIIDGESLYSYSRILGDGGTFNYAMDVMKDGLGLVDVSWRDFDTYDYVAMEKNDVYSYMNSKYDVVSTVDYPRLNLSTLDLSLASNVQKRENYINSLKQLIMENGGAYVATVDPVSRCAISVNGYRLMYDDDKCASGAHAMQVIGWDDDFSYSFCSGQKDASQYYYLGNSASCTTGKVISGKGAWLIKNSWGTTVPYVYLAYDSMGTEFNTITGMEEKNWDNYKEIKSSTVSSLDTMYIKELDGVEKLNKLKFRALKQNVNYTVCVGLTVADNCKTIRADFPGIHTVDFSDSNILIDDSLKVKITATSTSSLEKVSIYTENVGSDIDIITEDSTYSNKLSNINKYIMRISSKTINISEGEEIDYKILDMDRNEIDVNYTYSENNVFANQVFSKLLIDPNLELGTYVLQTIYNDEVIYESKLFINTNVVTIEGKGTEEEPYIINNPSQLNLMHLDRFAFYKLGQDIDLTYDTQDENGLFYNDGKGWEPIKYSIGRKNLSHYLYFDKGFSGGFDGNNHKIIGLYINRPDEDGVGLFASTYNENYSNLHIKNLSLVEPFVMGRDWVGSLVGVVHGTTYERFLNISNIQVIGGYICGNNYVGGIAGLLNSGSWIKTSGVDRHTISNLYNSAFIDAGDYGGGLFGMISNTYGYGVGKSPIKISNVLNKGPVMSYGYAGGIAGYVITRDTNDINIINAMNTGEVIGDVFASNVVGEFSDDSEGNLNLNNIYYINSEEVDFVSRGINVSNVMNKNFAELKNSTNYSLWDSFDTNWKIETISGITRLPVLKFVNFEYLSIDDIEIYKDEKVNVMDYVYPQIDAALYNKYEIVDTSIASMDLDGFIKGLNSGVTKMHVVSYFDGYEKDINIKVNNTLDQVTISFESNGGTKVDSITADIGSEIVEPNVPIKEGYNFVGWYLDNETFENKYEFNGMPDEDIILYAKWDLIERKIIFESNGGTKVDSITVTINSDGVVFDSPVREGYNFVGWYLDNETFEDKYEFNGMPDEDIILYAKWDEININIDNYKINNNLVIDISVGTSIRDYLDNFSYDKRLKVEFYNNKNELVNNLDNVVTTGSIVRFYDGSSLLFEYTNIVSGDVDGDGMLKLSDIMKIANYIYINKNSLADAYLYAGDYNKDKNYDLKDIMKMAYDLYT